MGMFVFKPVSQSKKTSKCEGVNVQCIQNQLKGQRGVHHYGLVTMKTTTPVSEAGAKAEKKDEQKETDQNIACDTQKHFRQEVAKMSRQRNKVGKKKKNTKVFDHMTA